MAHTRMHIDTESHMCCKHPNHSCVLYGCSLAMMCARKALIQNLCSTDIVFNRLFLSISFTNLWLPCTQTCACYCCLSWNKTIFISCWYKCITNKQKIMLIRRIVSFCHSSDTIHCIHFLFFAIYACALTQSPPGRMQIMAGWLATHPPGADMWYCDICPFLDIFYQWEYWMNL